MDTILMNQLIYQIAEEVLVLRTKEDLTEVRSVLDKYEPFARPEVPEGKSVLLSVSDRADIKPEESDELVEEVRDMLFRSAVYRRASGEWLLEISHAGRVVRALADRRWTTLALSVPLSSSADAQLIDRLIMIVFSVATFPLGLLKVHASVITLSGRALVLLGVSGTGKSTHSRLWLEFVPGSVLLNDDEPIVRIKDGQVRVYGCPWSGSTPCYKDASAEVLAFVHLYQAQENRLTKLKAHEAFNSLYTSCALFAPEEQVQKQVFNTVLDVLELVPVYRLDNRPERAAVELTHSLMTLAND